MDGFVRDASFGFPSMMSAMVLALETNLVSVFGQRDAKPSLWPDPSLRSQLAFGYGTLPWSLEGQIIQ